MKNAGDEPVGANVFIGTPAYNCQIHTAYLRSVLDFSAAGLSFRVFTVGNESLVTRARNTIISEFFRCGQFTHLLFLDADVGLAAEGLERLMRSGRDVIGAAVPMKTITREGRRRYNMGELIGREGVIARTRWLGTAVLILSRRAVEALVKDAADSGRHYRYRADPEEEEKEYFDVFQVGVVDETYLSEDFWICRRLQELGYDVHVDLGIKPSHHGMYSF